MSSSKAAFVYSEECLTYDFGPSHVFRPERAFYTFKLLKEYAGLSSNFNFVEPRRAGREELLLFHTERYVDALLSEDREKLVEHGIGPGDNPYFSGIGKASSIAAGASITAAEMLLKDYDIAFSFAGGLHHAHPDYAYGFCIVNDIVLSLKKLIEGGFGDKGSILYVDVDAHFGDGVVYGLYNSDQVVTFSMHESGRYLFPGTGFSNETGKDKGEGLKINVPLPPYSAEKEFLTVLDEVLFPLVEVVNPEILALQLGTDGYREDPLTHLKYSPYCYFYLLEELYKLKRRLGFKLLVYGGGGYVPWFASLIWFASVLILNGAAAPYDAVSFVLNHKKLNPGMPESIQLEPAQSKITPEYEEEFEMVVENSTANVETARRILSKS